MTPYLFLLGFAVGTVLTIVRHPVWGLYTYLFTFYMAPAYTWWRNDVPDIRYLAIIGAITLIATLRLPPDPNRPKWHQTTIAKLYLAFVAYCWLQMLWAVDKDWQLEGAAMFTKHAVAFYLFYRLADSLDRLLTIALIHVIGCAWFGYQALGAGSGRLEQIGGAVAGANELGMHLATGLLFGGIMLFAVRGVRRIFTFGCLPLIANCLVLTVSRGAFLGLVVGGAAGYLAVPKNLKKIYIGCAMLGVVLFGMLAHNALIERFTATYAAFTGETDLDSSAVKRIDVAKAGIRIGLDYPFGAGYRGTGVLSPQYMDESLLGVTGVRTAHNSSAALFAEQGFIGLGLYYLMILWVLRTMRRMRALSELGTPREYQLCMAFLGASLLSTYAAGNFSNNVGTETQYWCLGLLAAAFELQKAHLRSKVTAPAEQQVMPHTGVTART